MKARHLLLAGAWAYCLSAHAVDTELPFDDAALNERYGALIHEVRCLVCQNQTIADSNAPLAADLRREIRERVAAGESDKEIVEFIVGRYGDFALYRPPVRPSTWALWGAPALFVLLGATAFVRILRARSGASVDQDGD